jgi:hypothetical protein
MVPVMAREMLTWAMQMVKNSTVTFNLIRGVTFERVERSIDYQRNRIRYVENRTMQVSNEEHGNA